MLRRAPHLAAVLRLAGPVILVQVGMMAMGVVDTIMIGHLEGTPDEQRTALAAVGLGNFYAWLCLVFSWGCLMALDPIVAQAVGAGDAPAIARGLQRGLLLAGVLSLPAMLAALPAQAFFELAGQQPEVVPPASRYSVINAAGYLPFFVFTVFRQTLQALGRLRSIVFCVLASNLINFLLNWMLVYGRFGFEPMGVAGSAWATVLSRWLMAAILLWMAWGSLAPHLVPWRTESFSRRPLLRMLRIGLPIGGQYLLEFFLFGVAALMMGWFGLAEIAGHQVALNLAAFSFNLPLGISAAAAVLVGRAVGRGNLLEARRSAVAALFLGVVVMLGFCILFLTLPQELASIYTKERAALAMASLLIPIAGVFQIFDGIQVVSIGILRGFGDTLLPVLINLVGFWLLGLPTSVVLAFGVGLGPSGIWLGFVVGLGSVALLLLYRVRQKLREEVVRLQIDEVGDPAVPAASSSVVAVLSDLQSTSSRVGVEPRVEDCEPDRNEEQERSP